MKRVVIFLILILTTFAGFSQQKVKDTIIDNMILIEGDSIEFSLDEINLLKKLKFENQKAQRYYYWYWKKVHKAYPFATLTANTLQEIDDNLARFKSKRKKRKYIRKAQKYLKGEFTEQLKKLTRTEGKILIKLIHRQTGTTTFNLIRKYRSGWKAFWYNTTANLFKLSLKKEYHPEKEALDFLVEDILQRAFINNSLKEHKSKLDFNYYDLIGRWKDIDIVYEIKNR
jgi:hypothetical protein